jgi:signal transduction histidine kinase
VEWLGEAIALTRQLSVDLSPLDLRKGGLAFAILSLCSQMKARYGLDVELTENDFALQFEDSSQITLFQALRELLFNIVKHSGSLKATVTLEQVDQNRAHIIVSDAGKGYNPRTVLDQKRRGRGLKSIQQELKLFGCQLEMDSAEQKGARMIINIPLRVSGSGS